MTTSNDKSFELVFNKYELGLKKEEKLEKENEKLRKENDELRNMARSETFEIVHDTELIKKNETLLAENTELKEKLAQSNNEFEIILKYSEKNMTPIEFNNFRNKMIDNAIKNGNFECVKYIFDNGNYYHNEIEDYLNESFKYKNADIIKYFIQKENKTKADEHLYSAIRNGNLEIVKHLIEHGLYINHESLKYNNYGCLTNAAEKGYLEVIKYVKKMYNFDINVNNGEILRYAVADNHFDLVKWLIEECLADIHADNEHPLLNAVNHKHFDIVKYLIAHGATVNATLLDKIKNNSSKEIVNYLESL